MVPRPQSCWYSSAWQGHHSKPMISALRQTMSLCGGELLASRVEEAQPAGDDAAWTACLQGR